MTAAALVAVAAVVGGLVILRRRYLVMTVDGISMSPTLEHADRILVRRTSSVARGQIVVVRRPHPVTGWRGPAGGGWYVKRAVAVGGDPVPADAAAMCRMDLGDTVPDGLLLIIGDNPRSEDSKQWGYCPADRLLGVYLRTLTRWR